MGGENHVAGPNLIVGVGSSPRGRGKRVCVRRSLSRRAHPRVGGENLTPAGRLVIDGGSSPRGRGKRDRDIRRRLQGRLIPAWAGKTRYRVRPRHRLGAHPRVDGENLARAVSVVRPGGSSPRGRGKLTLDDPGHVMRGLIPAWAGKTTGEPVDARHTGAHPRVGGENPPGSSRRGSGGGSSPRGRGKRHVVGRRVAGVRLIPAWAGKTRT